MYSPRGFVQKNRVFLSALLYGLFSMLISYCCISAVAGKGGLFAYQDLLAQRATMQKALDFLQEQNQAKALMVDDLKGNSAVTADRAAALGYIRQGETLIVLPESWRNAVDNNKGTMRLPVVVGDSTGLPDMLIRLMSAITGAFAFLTILLFQTRPLSVPEKAPNLEKQTELR